MCAGVCLLAVLLRDGLVAAAWQIDERLPELIFNTLDNLFLLLGCITTICVVFPYMLIPVLPLGIAYGFLCVRACRRPCRWFFVV